MNKLLLLCFIILPSFSFASYQAPWVKICESRLTNKQSLYEVYHDCIDLCMLSSQEHRERKMKEKHRICTTFTAKLHNRQSKTLEVNQALNTGIRFCTNQKIHRNGGHWLYVSRQCKRTICEDKSEAVQRQHEVCKKMNHHLNNGRVIEAYQIPTKSDIERKGTAPNTLLKEGEPSAPLDTNPAP